MVAPKNMEVPRTVYRDGSISDAECRVLGVILSFVPWSTPQKPSTVSIPTIMELSGKSRAAVYRATTGLIQKGVIERVRDDRGIAGFSLIDRLTSETKSLTSETAIPTSETPKSHKWDSQHYRNHELNHDVNCRPNGTTTPSAQLALGEFGETEVEKPSAKKAFIANAWKLFTDTHRQTQDWMIQAGDLKRRSGFKERPEYLRMLGRLYSEKYTLDELSNAWGQCGNEAMNKKTIKWLKPSTCFVPKNINHQLEESANDDAQEEPQEIAPT